MFCDRTSRIYCLFCALHVFSRCPVTVKWMCSAKLFLRDHYKYKRTHEPEGLQWCRESRSWSTRCWGCDNDEVITKLLGRPSTINITQIAEGLTREECSSNVAVSGWTIFQLSADSSGKKKQKKNVFFEQREDRWTAAKWLLLTEFFFWLIYLLLVLF